MIPAPKYGTLALSSAPDIHACLLDERGEPGSFVVTLDESEDAVVWDRQHQSFVYKCRFEGATVRVLECYVGSAEDAEAVISRLTAPGLDASMKRLLLAGVPRKPHKTAASPEPEVAEPTGVGPPLAMAAGVATRNDPSRDGQVR